jgi:hypothetical protein
MAGLAGDQHKEFFAAFGNGQAGGQHQRGKDEREFLHGVKWRNVRGAETRVKGKEYQGIAFQSLFAALWFVIARILLGQA